MEEGEILSLPCFKTVVQRLGIRSQHHHQIDPAAWEQVAGVPVDYVAPCLDIIFNDIQKLDLQTEISL